MSVSLQPFIEGLWHKDVAWGTKFGVKMNIQNLQLWEPAQLDKNRLAEIVARLGPRGADDFVSRAMEELAVQLAKVHKGHHRGARNETAAAAAKIAGVAAHVGMAGLARVAGDVEQLAALNDTVALGASVARLARVGESSLMTVWDLQDLSI